MPNVTQWADALGSGITLTPQGAGGVPIIGTDPATKLIQSTSTAGLTSALVALFNQSLPFSFYWVGQGLLTDTWFLAGLADSGGASYTMLSGNDFLAGDSGFVNANVNPSGGPLSQLRHKSTKLRLYKLSRNGTALTGQAGYSIAVAATIGAAANANGSLGLGTLAGSFSTALHRAALVRTGGIATANDDTFARAWARLFHGSVSGSPSVALWEGDSITNGFTGTGNPYDSWATRVADVSPFLGWDDDNFASDGAGIVSGIITTRGATVDGYFASHPATTKRLVLFAGTNDIAGNVPGGATATASAIFSYVDARKAATSGLKVAVCTMLARDATPGHGSSVDQATMNAGRSGLNTALRDSGNIAAHGYTLIDFAADSRFSADTSFSNTTYYLADGTHLNSTGAAALASIASPIIAAM